MTTPREYLLEKLYDAYRLERRALRILNVTQEIARLCPRLRARIRDHATETKWQMRLLEVCLENMGVKPSSVRGKWSWPPAHTGAAFKRREIGAYRALIAAADKAGEEEIAQVGREILTQELAMSTWLDDYLYPASSSRVGALS